MSDAAGPTPAGVRPRWFTEFGPGHSTRYVERFRALAAQGVDVDGEARFVDALLPRGARVLDAGCGPGRVGAALHARGHCVVGIDADAELIAAAAADHPGPTWLVGDLGDVAHLTNFDSAAGEPFDAVVLAGNVMVFLAPGSEHHVVAALADSLADDGVLVAGFATDRDYRASDFDRHCAQAGLVLEQRFATWDLRPWRDGADWVVSVLRRPVRG